MVDYIRINFYGVEKEDIFIGINKWVEDKFGFDQFIKYETYITNIPNFHTGYASFSMKFEDVEENYCSFKKYDDALLLLICGILNHSTNEIYLSEFENEIISDNINIKYNFRIQPLKYSKNLF